MAGELEIAIGRIGRDPVSGEPSPGNVQLEIGEKAFGEVELEERAAGNADFGLRRPELPCARRRKGAVTGSADGNSEMQFFTSRAFEHLPGCKGGKQQQKDRGKSAE